MHTVRQIANRVEIPTLRAYRRGRVFLYAVTVDRPFAPWRLRGTQRSEIPLPVWLAGAVVAALKSEEVVNGLDHPRVGTR